MATFLLAAAGAGGLGGCADPDKEVSFEASEPAARIRAIKEAGRTEDPKAIPDLIRSLDSEDPMQRMLAIRTLEKMTGQTLGYQHAAPPWQRDEAVERWVDWAHQEGLAPHPRPADGRGQGRAPTDPAEADPGGPRADFNPSTTNGS